MLVVGKRKTSVAKVLIKPGNGCVRVNGTSLEIWQPEVARLKIMEPLILAEGYIKNVDMDAYVKGGGYMSQAEAVRMAIARAICRWVKRERVKKLFLTYDRTMLVGDPRRTEPKKFGGPSARTRRQKSYR
jgi:small subunit ribosomal protein S9